MTALILRRLAIAPLVIVSVLITVFLLVHVAGDPAAAALGPNATPEALAELRAKHGWDQPVLDQLGSYFGVSSCVRKGSRAYGGHCGLVQGDLGESIGHHEPVGRVIAHRLPRTLLLGGLAIFFELLIGLGIGIVAAVRRNTWVDTSAMSAAFLGISLPTYVTGPLFLIVFAFLYGWFPLGGYGSDPADHVFHAILPASTLAIFGAATYARIMRSEMIDALQSDFVRTAQAKGLSQPAVVLRHAARTSLLPIVTMVGLSMRLLVSGAIITEGIFNWPGMGLLALESILNLDAPTLMGVVLVFVVVVQVGNLLADVAVAALDPRVRPD